jgi:hypothetical protein
LKKANICLHYFYENGGFYLLFCFLGQLRRSGARAAALIFLVPPCGVWAGRRSAGQPLVAQAVAALAGGG